MLRRRSPQSGAAGAPPVGASGAASGSGRPARAGGSARGWIKAALLLLPTILGTIYFGLIAADQYESEARFIVRAAPRPSTGGGFDLLLQLGGNRSQDNAYAVLDYITSRDAVRELRTLLPIDDVYRRSEADFLARYPSILFGPTDEEFYLYLQYAITATHLTTTGVSTLRVKTFRSDDAKRVADALLMLGERLVNRINERMQRDTVSASEAEVKTSQERLVRAQLAVAEFRNRELMINPTKSAVALADLIARLSVELARTKARLSELTATAPDNSQLPSVRRHVSALEAQIAQERARITDSSDNLSDKLREYEKLLLDVEFASRMLTYAETELTRARSEALRQQIYLQRIAEPLAPDYAMKPQRIAIVLTIFSLNLMALLVGWLLFTGVREHGAGPH